MPAAARFVKQLKCCFACFAARSNTYGTYFWEHVIQRKRDAERQPRERAAKKKRYQGQPRSRGREFMRKRHQHKGRDGRRRKRCQEKEM